MTENFAKSLIKIVPKWIQSYVYHKNELNDSIFSNIKNDFSKLNISYNKL